MRSMRKHSDITPLLVHTGQHLMSRWPGSSVRTCKFHCRMSHYDVGSGTHAVQTAEVYEELEPIVEKEHPDGFCGR